MPEPSITFPLYLYPAVAPLPIPMANHLLHQEEQQYRRRPSKRPRSQELIQTVLERIRRARIIVYEYLRPFVLADKKRQQRGEGRVIIDPDWLLETLAQYTPQGKKNDASTLDYWQKRGLLWREKARGSLDVTSVASLMIARLVERHHQRNWLPPSIHETEPRWWCYGRSAPDASIQAIPIPFSSQLSASLIVWTQWQGAIWEEGWQMIADGYLYRWATNPSVQDLFVWDEEIPHKILSFQQDSLFGLPAVQLVLLQEARKAILSSIVQKGMCYEGSLQPGKLFH